MSGHDSFSSQKDQTQKAYSFSFTHLSTGEPLNLSDFKGKVMLVVNTASKCGFTSQYEDLENLYKLYKDKGLVVIGVPSNDFGGQEPGTNEQIATFCKLNYEITFTMTKKEKVSGDGAHPFYVWAKKTLGFGTAPKWNFHKYLINRQGEIIDYFHSTTSPLNQRLKKALEKALSEVSTSGIS
ncbi:MAG: glutathione peroxidase [Alphaproteobacteria bacterium]|nr:glutathione peroxidase [Alphaproteobacteria bacterium]